MEKNKAPIRICKESKDFLNRLSNNLIRAETETQTLSYDDLLLRIAKYFKLNNDRYLELVKIKGEDKKC